uniref:Uncharacterized protein n=1 Tax=Oryza barthii TaxID=65489 RepID=A0A0D3GF28_9ORYZ
MAQFVAPASTGRALSASASTCFVCCSDELRFDAPARAMAVHDALRLGQLYFVLPVSALHRPFSDQDMAALTVKAIAALGASATAAAAGGNSSSISVSSRGKNASPASKQRQQTTARVAPIRRGSTEVALLANAQDCRCRGRAPSRKAMSDPTY